MHSFWPITGVRISGVGDVELVAQACEPFGSVEPSEARRSVVAGIFGFSGAARARDGGNVPRGSEYPTRH